MRKTIMILAGLATLAAAAPAFAHDGYGDIRRDRADIRHDYAERDAYLRRAQWARSHGDWRAARYWEAKARAEERDIMRDRRDLREDRYERRY